MLCDRYTDSSEAYQGAGRGLGAERVLEMHKAACDNVQPDLTLLLLPPLEASLTRARRRNDRHAKQHGTDEGRFEREGDEFYRKVYEQYRAIAEREPQRVVLLNEPGTVEQVGERIASVVRERMGAMVETANSQG